MKRYIVALLLLAIALPVAAQHGKKPHGKKHHEITELVSDLSSAQKRKIEEIGKQSRERVLTLRNQQKAVKDSIAMFIDREGDNSTVLYRLFDREASLQVSISREMYDTKLLIDQILTPQQREELRRSLSKDRKGK